MDRNTAQLMSGLIKVIAHLLRFGWKNIKSGKWQIRITDGYLTIDDRAKRPDFLFKIKLSILSDGLQNMLYNTFEFDKNRSDFIEKNTRPDKEKSPNLEHANEKINIKVGK